MSAAGLRIVAEAIRAVRERDELRGHAEALSAEIEVWRALAEDSGRAEETLCTEVDRLHAELTEARASLAWVSEVADYWHRRAEERAASSASAGRHHMDWEERS